MTTYFATFIPGFKEVIENTLKRDVKDIYIVSIFESSVFFKTKYELPFVNSLIYLNNVFLVLNFKMSKKDQLIGKVVQGLFDDCNLINIKSESSLHTFKTFRLMIQKGSKLINIPRKIRTQIIETIADATSWKFSPLKADTEFWFLIREENVLILGVKNTHLNSTLFQQTKDGQLRPKLAHILNLLSEPNKDDTYLDPFAGYGALPLDRASYFSYKQIYVSDIDEKLISDLKKQFLKKPNILIRRENALNLKNIPNDSISKIVTDPPWGFYDMKNENFEIFYDNMLKEMIRICQKKSIIIILTAKTFELEQALHKAEYKIQILKKLNILVNGKKASVFKIAVS